MTRFMGGSGWLGVEGGCNWSGSGRRFSRRYGSFFVVEVIAVVDAFVCGFLQGVAVFFVEAVVLCGEVHRVVTAFAQALFQVLDDFSGQPLSPCLGVDVEE